MTHFGIMTMNNHIPYKKPILKSMPAPANINAKGVIHELDKKHGGLYYIKYSSPSKLEIND